ncbi:UDP-N-acetylmuramate--L-alanine ligase [bacterium]|nr:UDP-N-acetylmuramate--L-alanine ligase [bacterium]
MDNIDHIEFRHVHFVGVGGIGMSGIAKVLLQMGYKVSGSDLRTNRITECLKELGAEIYRGHDPANVKGADLIVVSSAVPRDNPERLEAERLGIRVIQRGKMLSLLLNARVGIAIAGTHGKTTTSSMVASMLEGYGMKPTVVVGGVINSMGTNAKLGTGDYFVAEADESDASFVELAPEIAVVTSIDADVNLSAQAFSDCGYDHNATSSRVKEMFLRFIGRVGENGLAVLCYDHPGIKEMRSEVKCRVLSYGLDPEADIRAVNIELDNYTSRCTVFWRDRELGVMRLPVPGTHNVQNALAAVAVGVEVGLDFSDISRQLANFSGVRRRFQILSRANGIVVVDDYAHNPSKIKAAIHAAHTGSAKRVIAVFQPHRYTRTRFFKDQYATCFDDVDMLLVTDIYASSEEPIPGVSMYTVVDAVRSSEHAPEVVAVPTHEDIIAFLSSYCREGDIVLFLGAGDITSCAAKAAEALACSSEVCTA